MSSDLLVFLTKNIRGNHKNCSLIIMIIAKKLINIRHELFKFQIVKNEPPNHVFYLSNFNFSDH
jgi:hypothetical protein